MTYFFNGGDEVAFDGEDRHLVNSPQVATYDLQPQMSAQQVLAAVLDAVNSRSHDLIIVNFANPDMVGHTGDLSAAVTAVETVDKAVGQIAKAVTAAKGALLLTADHGNCEVMWDTAANSPHTAHTTSLVPVILVSHRQDAAARSCRMAVWLICPDNQLHLLGIAKHRVTPDGT